MARVVKTDVMKHVLANIITTFSDGSSESVILGEGDVVNDLRFVDNGRVRTVSGKITKIKQYCSGMTPVKTSEPVDYFQKDVKLTTIVIDASSKYESEIVYVPTNEIVEFPGKTNVTSVHVYPHPMVDITIHYSDETEENQSFEIGDLLENMVIMGGTPGSEDIVGNFFVEAFAYVCSLNRAIINGMYLVPTDDSPYKEPVLARFGNIISLVEIPTVKVDDTKSMAAIKDLLEESDDVMATFDVDVEIPKRDDGKITTLFINEGKTLTVDLNGHNLTTQAYAFYVNGGVLNITDTSGEGKIESVIKNNAYPVVFVSNNGVCNMTGGKIDTTNVILDEETDYNWLYGVVCSGNGIFNMTGGEMIIGGASGISITNGTASGYGVQFTIGGDAVIRCIDNASVYLADNKSVVIEENAKLYGGIVARMGDVTIRGNATVEATDDINRVYALGEQVVLSGVGACAAGILGLTGIYNSSLGNDMNIAIQENARVISHLGKAVEIAKINTKYDQNVRVYADDHSNLVEGYRVYSHNELAELATEAGKVLGPEVNTTDLRIEIGNEVVYPLPDNPLVEEPENNDDNNN